MWHDVPGYDYLQVTEDGRVRSLGHKTWTIQKKRSFWQFRPGKELKVQVRDGRRWVGVRAPEGHNCKQVPVGVARLMCLAFYGPPPEGKPFACHRDDNALNDTKGNLYWGSPKENSADKAKNGNVPRREKHHATPLTEDQVAEIKATYKPKTKDRGSFALAAKYGVHRTTIENIVAGRSWK